MRGVVVNGVIALLALGALATGCNKAQRSDITVQRGGQQVAAAQKHEQRSVALAGGESVQVIEVARLDANPAQFEGRIALAGKVEEVFADRDAFSLVDPAKMSGCSSTCCSMIEVAMRVPEADFEGEMPAPGDELIVIGTLTPEPTGFSFTVLEVRRGDETLLHVREGAGASNV